MALLASCSVAKATAIDPARCVDRLSADVSQYGVPIGLSPLLKVTISSITRAIPSGVLKSAVGIPWIATLCQASSFWAALKAITCSQIDCFSSRKSAEKALVVVTTIFWLSDLLTEATTGPSIPLSANALLNALRIANGLKWVWLPVADLTRIRRFEAAFLGLGVLAVFF